MPYAKSAAASIYYEVHGDGPGLVLAHGAGGNRVVWFQQVPYFAERHRVVTFDHRCFGRSECEPADFHPKHFSADLLAVLDAAGIERTALVCQSMGGWTGLRTALEHPERVSCLVLCGTPGGVITDGVLAAFAQLGARIGEEGVRGNAALAPDFPKRRPDLAHLYDQIGALNTGVEPRMLGTMLDEEARIRPDQLRGFAVPTLMISGAHDQLFPPEVLREVAERIPGAELHAFPEVGHSSYFEDADAFNARVSEFVDRHRG